MPIGRWLDGGVRRSRAAAGGDEDRGGGRGGGRGGSGRGRGRPRSESYISEDRKRLGYEIIRVQWSVDRCAVCDDDRDFDFDQLVTCEGCAISVHQSCYGIPEIPDDAVGWLCAACEHTGGVVSETPLCCLCPVEGGALKPTTKPGRWCHSACCQWIPETTVLDVDTMQPIDQIDTIQRERWELLCTVCKQRHGAKIQCDHPGCYLAYHPLCARASGLFMEARLGEDDGEDEDSPLMMVSYCHRHCLVDTERAAFARGRSRQKRPWRSPAGRRRRRRKRRTRRRKRPKTTRPPPRSGKRAFVELIPYVAENAARLAAKTSGAVAVAAMEIAAAIVDEGKGVRERMEEAHDFLHERFTFGKSNIHGWGLIAKKPVKAGSMVIEFRGEIVKPHVADLREKAYDDANIDCYLLKADEKTVIDTTMRGNIARFTNHSCNPNMYTKIVSVDGSNHIIFFARVDVQPGEEMTYDYRFDAESGKVPCYCGAHNCRGFLC
ncbi:set domain protein [Micromonas pusilla CCMP1545]|uniref:Set domain protein n=1 Tax=Micromonas pusilla (strain CCMP1545) TaxID=564608 RepID=C1N3U5_MICPC|nr:set domain protein [Micromonas pusilla CCMP1545]EEH53253.1 set domain protein [Micromonas pusilla CCMP1545]|eukprot:XP_003062434.1 set domain protein [Micromonas pusilla CCMP1545]